MQAAVFRSAGYPVETIARSNAIQRSLESRDFDVVIFNHSLALRDRKSLARQAKQLKPERGVLVLHNSGALGNRYVDLAVDSRLGPQAVLRALERLAGMLHVRSRHFDGFGGTYVVAADANRYYTFASDAACDLLGYDRAMFLELCIDDIVDGAATVAEPLFRRFVADGEQAGRITLRHRSGKLVRVNYWSKVESDGCMLARWEPMENQAIRRSGHQAI
jgi:PAS domain-containing protein